MKRKLQRGFEENKSECNEWTVNSSSQLSDQLALTLAAAANSQPNFSPLSRSDTAASGQQLSRWSATTNSQTTNSRTVTVRVALGRRAHASRGLLTASPVSAKRAGGLTNCPQRGAHTAAAATRPPAAGSPGPGARLRSSGCWPSWRQITHS